jgi:hypothetical protein
VERAFLLAQEHLLLVSPARHANAYARTAHDVSLGVAFSRGEAARLRVVRPGRWPALVPEAVTELRLSLVATADGGAALEGEADCSDASEAVGVATELQRRATAGSPSENAMSPYAGLETRAEGSRVLVHLAFAHERLEELVELVSSYLDVTSHRGR